jgi:hypothetical protein
MATDQPRSDDRLTKPLLDVLAAIPPPTDVFLYSVKIVCGRQTEGSCCCTAGARPGVYATEVNIQNLTLAPATVHRFFFPFINLGAVVGRDPTLAAPRIPIPLPVPLTLPPLAATMDDCCRIGELAWGAPPSGDTGLTVGVLTILSIGAELSISAVYTANPLAGDGISIDVEYIPSHRLQRPGQGGTGTTGRTRRSR